MYHPRTARIGIAAAAAAVLLSHPVWADNAKTADTTNAVDLGKIEVQGDVYDQSIPLVPPTSSLYGYEQTLKETPRSIFQVSKTQLDEDVIQNYNDLARYSPSVQQSSSSPYSTFANIRGGSSDTMRNGILLLNPAVRPFDTNSWQSADIVAGVPSVAFGSTTRTAGYVNYITKEPYFDQEHSQISTSFGRLGTNSDTTYGQYSTQIDTGGPLIKDKLAFRLSIEGSKANNYWANSKANFFDLYGALSWKPTSKLTVESNITYTKSDGPYVYGINRITQDLVDNYTYISGAASPILSYGGKYYRANSAGTYDVGTSITNGKFISSGTTTPAAWSQAKPASLVGWVLLPENAKETPVKGSETLYNKDSFSIAHEYIAQVISTFALNETFSIRNNTLFQYSDSYVYGYDEYHSFMVNKFVTSRIELISNHSFRVFGQDVIHKSNSGFDFRNLWNLCDNVGKPSERPVSSADVTDAGTFGSAYLLGLSSLYPNPLVSSASLYTPELTKYGWINIAPGYVNSNGRSQGLSVASIGGTDLRINQLSTYSLYTEHDLDIGDDWSWRAGARLTRIEDYLRATPRTYEVADEGYLPGIRLSDNAVAWNSDFNTSLNYRPTKRITTYVTYDYDKASADCGCCLTQGFVGPNNSLERTYYKVPSELYEAGVKFEAVPNKLLTSLAVFRQTRAVPSIPTASNPNPAEVSLLYKGAEFSITYLPTKHLKVGANYAYLWATNVNQTAAAVYTDYNGFVADGSTIVNNATSSVGVNSGVRGNYRVLGIPLNSANGWTSYQFDNGFGVKASAWVTSPWQVTRLVTVHTQYNLDLGAFYTLKKWRYDLTVQNITDQKNWSPGGTYGGGTFTYLLPQQRLGVSGRITYRF
jgi:hypothetical protein